MILEIRQELKDRRTWFMPRMSKPRSLEHNSRKIKGRHDRPCINRDDLAKELEKDKHDQKEPSET